MLLNNLYTIVENQKDENKIFSQIEINPHHEVFKGHFPAQPILPGVCMIEIAKEILQENFKQKLFLSQSSTAKFLNMFLPNQNTMATFEIEFHLKELEEIIVNLTMKNQAIIYLKFKGIYKICQ